MNFHSHRLEPFEAEADLASPAALGSESETLLVSFATIKNLSEKDTLD